MWQRHSQRLIVKRFGKKERPLVAPLFVAGPHVDDTQVKEAVHSVEIRRCFEEDLWLSGVGPPAELRMIHRN